VQFVVSDDRSGHAECKLVASNGSWTTNTHFEKITFSSLLLTTIPGMPNASWSWVDWELFELTKAACH